MAEGLYTIYADNYAQETIEIARIAYKNIYRNGGHIGLQDIINSLWAHRKYTPAEHPDKPLLLKRLVMVNGNIQEVNSRYCKISRKF